MPIYEYECTSCGHQMEAIQKFSDEPLTLCPACAENTLEKMVSAPSFKLNGTGWYETDFKTTNKKQTAAKEKSSADSESRSDSDSDAA